MSDTLKKPSVTPVSPPAAAGTDLNWVWQQVCKRIATKIPLSLPVSEALQSAVPIHLEDDLFVCGLPPSDFVLANSLTPSQVRKTIENILSDAARRRIRFELIEGTTLADWQALQQQQELAHSAIIAIAERKFEDHHYSDVLNQIVSEIRKQITSTPDRTFPSVRAQLLLSIIPQLADIEEMLFAEQSSRARHRSISRAIERIASLLEIESITIALELERHLRQTRQQSTDAPQ